MRVGAPTYSDPVIVLDDVVVYSASDLAVAAGCEYALLRAFDAHLGRGSRVQADDELLARTALLGGEHENRHLDKLRAQISEKPTVIGRPAYSRAAFTAAAEQTREAVQRRAPVHRLQVLVAVAEIQTNGVLPALVGLQLVAFGVTAKALGGEVVGNPVDPTIHLPVGQPLVAPR